MRLTAAILLVTLLQVSASGLAQVITLSKSKASLKTVLKDLRTLSGFEVVYTDVLLSGAKPVTVNINKASLTDALDEIFKDQPLIYTIDQKTIIIKAKEPSLLEKIMVIISAADISGTVVNEAGSPMPGVTIRVKGRKTASTGTDGRFTLTNVAEDALVVFDFVGYESKQIKASEIKGANFTVSLKPSSFNLNEVVAVGYGTTKRKDLTGSVSSVNVEEIKNTPFISVDQALTGKSPGVQVTQSDGSPGGMARIRIRGGSSLIGGNDPLYIIDGVQVTIQNRYVQSSAEIMNPVEGLGSDNNYAASAVGSSFSRGLNTLAGLNVNDIETIDILKDASATAIYGSRAANGVVIITTKKGKLNEKPILEANYYTGISKAITEKLLNAEQYKSVLLEGSRNLNALRVLQGRPADATATSIINNPNFLGTANTNWLDLITRTGITNNADLSVRGGGSGSRYYTSLAYADQKGTLLGTDFRRLAGKVNLDNEITSRLRLITNLDYAFTKNNVTNGIYGAALYAPPTLAPYAADGTPAVYDAATFGLGASVQNPLSLLRGKNTATNSLVLGSISLEYDILKSLKFRSTASVNYNNYHQLNYVPSSVSIVDVSGINSINSNGGVATQAQTQQTDIFYENTLTWDKQFNDNHRITLLAGTSWQKTNSETFSASGQGFPDDQFLNGLSSAAIPLPPKNSEAQSALLSFYMRANYALREKYLFTVTARSDESSKFPKNNRTSYFPSFGVAWKANEESFLKSVKWLNELKFRASAGYTGSQNLGNNLFYTLFTPVAYAGTNALIPTQLGNDQIKWETTLQKDAGVDFALFNSRLRGSVGYYTKNTSDLLMAFTVATSSGFNSALVNVADINNRGLEIDLRADVVRKKDFNWNIAVNLSRNRSKVTNINRDLQNPGSVGQGSDDEFLNSQLNIGNTLLREGEPIGLIYGFQYDGVIKNQQELDAYKTTSFYAQLGLIPNLSIGSPRYKVVESGTYKGFFKRDVIGNAQPDFYGGMTNTFSYKQFSLIALTTYSVGGDLLYLPDLSALGLSDRGNRNTRILLPHFNAENPNSDRPSLLLNEGNAFATGSSDLQVHDASFIRLKSVALNYQLTDKTTKKLGLRSAMVYVSASNLFTITNYPGPDPEISNDPYSLISGYTDSANYPSMRQFSFGVRLGF